MRKPQETVKIAAPGFILMSECDRDFRGAMRRVSEMGYDGIELMGFYGKDADETRGILEEYHLEPFGCFVPGEKFLGEKSDFQGYGWADDAPMMNIHGSTMDDQMEYIRSVGCSYASLCTYPTMDDVTSVRYCRALEETARRHGIRLQYHNHGWEYEKGQLGEYRMDAILEQLPDTVLFEPDLGWMAISGYDPAEALLRYAHRIEIVHMKDFYRISEEEFAFLPTGYGEMNWPKLLQLCEEKIRPKWYVMDHDKAFSGDIFRELEISVQYFKQLASLFQQRP